MNCSAIASYIAEKYDYEGEEDESEMWEDRSTSHWVALNNPSESAKQQYISYSLKLSRQYDAQADSDVFEVISELTSKWLYYCR